MYSYHIVLFVMILCHVKFSFEKLSNVKSYSTCLSGEGIIHSSSDGRVPEPQAQRMRTLGAMLDTIVTASNEQGALDPKHMLVCIVTVNHC